MSTLRRFFNAVSNSNRIFTAEDIGSMSGSEFSKNEKAIDYQMNNLGIPTDGDLAGNSDVVFVSAYTRADGTEVRAHYRSKCVHSSEGNASSVFTNTNNNSESDDLYSILHQPIGVVSGWAAPIQEPMSNGNSISNVNMLGELEKGEPMSIPQARENVNPTGDMNNCQTCVVVYEARQQGYNVSAVPLDNSNPVMMEIGFNPEKAYIDPKTGTNPEIKCSYSYNEKDCLKWLKDNIKPGERHIMSYIPRDGRSAQGHVLEVSKTKFGKITFYDPQINKEFDEKFLGQDAFFPPDIGLPVQENVFPRIYRVDNAQINPEILRKISVPSKHFRI